MRFQDTLRNLRISNHLTQMQLAQAIGTSQSAITSWETGYRTPDFISLKKIAAYFDVPLSTLFFDEFSEEDRVAMLADNIVKNVKLREIVDNLVMLPEEDIDTIASLVNALVRKNCAG